MKIAIVHDFLNQKIGGAEYVFFELSKIYPEADLFALIYNKKKFAKFFGDREVKASSLQKKLFKRNPKYLLPFIKKAVDKLDFSDYDLVITSSTAWVKNIKISGKTKHLCYCHSPARMLWDSWPRYLYEQRLGKVRRFLITQMVSNIRLWDYYSSEFVTQFISNSNFVKKRINKFYRLEAKTVYPPVNTSIFSPSVAKEDYYLILSVLSKYKNIDLAIKAFKSNKHRLIIAGDGPDKERLQKIADNAKNITFYGYANKKDKINLLKKARALIFPSIEDFGITPVEAMASATPVIALRGGGLSETLINNKTGVFFEKPSTRELNVAIKKSRVIKFKEVDLTGQAAKFDRSKFITSIKKEVNNLTKTDV